MVNILNAVLLSLIAGLATGVGGLLVIWLDGLNMRVYDALLGFAAGVMTAVATLGLIQESLGQGNALVTLIGIAVGATVLYLLDRYLPHEHERLPFASSCADEESGQPRGHGLSHHLGNALNFVCTNKLAYRQGLLLFAAMTLHNMPEGLAVGTSYAAQPRLGLLLALTIALHNIPEGVAIAGPFSVCGMSRRQCLLWTVGSGLAEPVAALLGALAIALFKPILPFSLAFAGGAMLYVVSDELIPESHSHGFEHQATWGFILGFMLLLTLSQLV